MKNDDKTFLKVGIIGAFLASLCCLGPLILIALGIGTEGVVLSDEATQTMELAPLSKTFGL